MMRFPAADGRYCPCPHPANQRRAALTVQQAGSPTVTRLLSFTNRHRAADAAVEAQVRIIRRALGLPPPQTS